MIRSITTVAGACTNIRARTRKPAAETVRATYATASSGSSRGVNRGVAGNDLGALVARELGILAPAGLLGVHVLQFFAFPSGEEAEAARLTPEDWASLQGGSTDDFQARSGYHDMQSKRPATVAFALDDSPAGAATGARDLRDRVTPAQPD